MLGTKGVVSLGTSALILTLSLGVPSAQAAACKGLESGACQNKDSCVWVKSYTRKDGVKVAGHCKSKPNKSSNSGNKK